MDNFDFLSKRELSYILNNEETFGNVLIEQIEEYCQRKRYAIYRIKAMYPEWEEDSVRLNFRIDEDEIVISKTDEAKRSDSFGDTFVIIMIALLLFMGVKTVLTEGLSNAGFWWLLFLIPFICIALLEVTKQQKKTKEKNQKNRELKILKNSEYQLFENDKLFYKKEVKAVNLFWKDDSDTGRSAILELKGTNHIAILIDEQGDLELFRIGNEISKFLGKKLNVFSGQSPDKAKFEL